MSSQSNSTRAQEQAEDRARSSAKLKAARAVVRGLPPVSESLKATYDSLARIEAAAKVWDE